MESMNSGAWILSSWWWKEVKWASSFNVAQKYYLGFSIDYGCSKVKVETCNRNIEEILYLKKIVKMNEASNESKETQ